MQLGELLHENRIEILPDFTGKIIRNGSWWFVGREFLAAGGKVIRCADFGDWRTGYQGAWSDQGETLEGKEREQFEAHKKESKEKEREERLRYQEEQALEAEKEWEGFFTLGESPYFKRKGFQGTDLYGCRLESFEYGIRTIVPARDADGKLWGFQRILSEKLAHGDKSFRRGSRKQGCFHHLGTPGGGEEPIYICEGMATALSVYLALAGEMAVVCAFDAGNLRDVGQSLRAKWPTNPIVFCADNDCYPSAHGHASHAGERKARDAALSIGNATVTMPFFPGVHQGGKPTDFNDLHVLMGLEEVKRALGERVPLEENKSLPGANTAVMKGKVGRAPAYPESSIVAGMVKEHQGSVLRNEGHYFQFTGTHWQHQENPKDFENELYLEIQALSQSIYPGFRGRDFDGALKRMIKNLPSTRHNMFQPNAYAQNFTNGTLYAHRQLDGTFQFEFRKTHTKNDLLIHCLPFDYNPTASLNEEVERHIENTFQGAKDSAERIRLYYQVGGACIMPISTLICWFIGPSGSGKSTLAKILMELMDKRFYCSIDPTSMDGFDLESAVGKLFNILLEVKRDLFLADAILKQVEDRIPVKIRLKGRPDIYAPLPHMHIFCANQMPFTKERGGTYDRRMEFIDFPNAVSRDVQVMDHGARLVAKNPDGVRRRFYEGLFDLGNQGGKFSRPPSSKIHMKQWDKDNQGPVEDFIDEIIDQGIEHLPSKGFLRRGEGLKMQRSVFWDLFKTYQQEAEIPFFRRLGKKPFFMRLRELGISENKIRGIHLVEGFGFVDQNGIAIPQKTTELSSPQDL